MTENTDRSTKYNALHGSSLTQKPLYSAKIKPDANNASLPKNTPGPSHDQSAPTESAPSLGTAAISSPQRSKAPQNKTSSKKSSNTRESNISTQQPIYHRRKCLFVHDTTLLGFDQSKLSNQFDLRTYYSKSIAVLSKDNKFKNLIRQTTPECIFIHVGLQDILNNRKKHMYIFV